MAASLACCAAITAPAQVQVAARVTPLTAGFRYDLSVKNLGPEEVALVSLLDAPFADILLQMSLIAPPGFMASYDDGLGIVDFLGDTQGFLSGITVEGFSFETAAAPDEFFTRFEALDIQGNSAAGMVETVVLPEATTVVGGLALAAVLTAQAWRNRARAGTAARTVAC